MSLRLTTWYNSHLGHDESIKSQEYSITFDRLLGAISQVYQRGKRETFPTISRMAQRIAELHKEDSDHYVRFTNGHLYPSDERGFVNCEAFVQLGSNHASTGRRLTESEFSQLTHEVLAALNGDKE